MTYLSLTIWCVAMHAVPFDSLFACRRPPFSKHLQFNAIRVLFNIDVIRYDAMRAVPFKVLFDVMRAVQCAMRMFDAIRLDAHAIRF